MAAWINAKGHAFPLPYANGRYLPEAHPYWAKFWEAASEAHAENASSWATRANFGSETELVGFEVALDPQRGAPPVAFLTSYNDERLVKYTRTSAHPPYVELVESDDSKRVVHAQYAVDLLDRSDWQEIDYAHVNAFLAVLNGDCDYRPPPLPAVPASDP